MELSLAGTPNPSPMGLKMCAPVIMAFGTPEQEGAAPAADPVVRHLVVPGAIPSPARGRTWPRLQMRAVRDGDDYVLNGSKIWTTHAQWADWMFCLVRTSTEGKPQEGISFLLLPMTLPGIQIKPLPTLDGPAGGRAGDQPGLLRQCPRAGRQPDRRGEQGLDLRQVPAGVRARQRLRARPACTAAQGRRRWPRWNGPTTAGRWSSDPDFRRRIAELEIARGGRMNATELADLRDAGRARRCHGRGLVDAEAGR